MKKYLMTWYGKTDLRASLGLEQSTGPVLGALLAEDYTDVIILGFTHPDKFGNEAGGFQQEMACLKDAATDAEAFTERFLNSVEAHSHFTQWLAQRLQDAGKKADIHFHPVCLKHLNDTEGIYEAAIQSLDAVAAAEGEKRITLYLSPGTPVMAFVWAFAALKYPFLEKRLIASSQHGKPPERISLPNEWLEWYGTPVRRADADEEEQYDVIFHLFGEQRMPNLLGVRQFSSKRHFFVGSSQYPAGIMKQFLGEAEYDEVAVDPYDPKDVYSTILGRIKKLPANAKIGFNLTGGTKLMYAGALAACRKVNATPFYFDSHNDQVVYLNDFKTANIKPLDSVETFFQLNGDGLFISKHGRWSDIPGIECPQREKLTREIWRVRSKISKLYKLLSLKSEKSEPFELKRGMISAALSENKKARISIGDKHFAFEAWPDFARYLSGGWFEEYTFMQLRPLVDAGLIKDMRIGLEVALKENAAEGISRILTLREQLLNQWGATYNEFDIVFTDGKRLYVIECKAGSVNSDYVMKLQNITRDFGGVEGRGFLVSCFPPNGKVVKKKIADAGNIELASGDNLFNQLREKIKSMVR